MTALSPARAPSVHALFEAHVDYVWRTLRRLGISATDAEDLTQEVFLVVHRRLSTYDPTRPIRPWIFGIARNLSREHHRRPRPALAHDEVRDEARSDPDLRALESAELLYRALAEMDEPLREVLVLKDLEERAAREVAEILETPESTVQSRLQQARAELRQRLRRHGGGGHGE